MELCPFCGSWYDDDNDTQPCCPGCGYPYTYEDGDGEVMAPAIDCGIDLDELLAEDLSGPDGEEQDPEAVRFRQTEGLVADDDNLI